MLLRRPDVDPRRIGMYAQSLGGADPNIACRALAAMFIADTHRPVDAIARIDRPVLLLHGTRDRVIVHSLPYLQS